MKYEERTRRALHDEGWLPKKAKFERALSEMLTVKVEATGARIQPYTKRRRPCAVIALELQI